MAKRKVQSVGKITLPDLISKQFVPFLTSDKKQVLVPKSNILELTLELSSEGVYKLFHNNVATLVESTDKGAVNLKIAEFIAAKIVVLNALLG